MHENKHAILPRSIKVKANYHEYGYGPEQASIEPWYSSYIAVDAFRTLVFDSLEVGTDDLIASSKLKGLEGLVFLNADISSKATNYLECAVAGKSVVFSVESLDDHWQKYLTYLESAEEVWLFYKHVENTAILNLIAEEAKSKGVTFVIEEASKFKDALEYYRGQTTK